MQARSQLPSALTGVLAPLEAVAPPSAADALELLRPDLSPVPFRGREQELDALAAWLAGSPLLARSLRAELSGTMLIVDRRPRPGQAGPDPGLSRARTHGGRAITVLTC